MTWVADAVNKGKKISDLSNPVIKWKIQSKKLDNVPSEEFTNTIKSYQELHMPKMVALINELGNHPNIEITHRDNPNLLITSFRIPTIITTLVNTYSTGDHSIIDYATGTRWHIVIYDSAYVTLPPRPLWKRQRNLIANKPNILSHLHITLHDPAMGNEAINSPLIALHRSGRIHVRSEYFNSFSKLKETIAVIIINAFSN